MGASVHRRGRRADSDARFADRFLVCGGPDPTRPAPMLKSLLVVGVVSIVFAIAVNLLLDTPGIESPKAIVNQLGLGKAAWSDLLIIAGVAMAAPIGEE